MSKQYAGPKDTEVRQELKEVSPVLHELIYSRTYNDLPSDFFERQREGLLKSTHKHTSTSVVKESLIKRLISLKSVAAIAASAALVLIAVNMTKPEVTNTSLFEEMDVATLEAYLLDQATYLDSDIAVSNSLLDLIED